MHPRKPCLAAVAAIARLCGAAGTMKVDWSTNRHRFYDISEGIFDLDGPWQAVVLTVGDAEAGNGVALPLWPSHLYAAAIPTAEVGGNYTVADSSSAIASIPNSSMTSGPEYFSFSGKYYFYSIRFHGAQAKGSLISLGKGGSIGSVSYSVQVGGVTFDQPGSFVLGGYEQNRLLGRAGTFPLPTNGFADFNPIIPLLDVVIGAETGGSPFGSPDSISMFVELGSNGYAYDEDRLQTQIGGPRGSALVMPDLTVPYIYQPPGNYEEITKHLPVFHDPNLDLYLWNTSDPQFARLVNSSAYLAFIFFEHAYANTTIKVPFRLINLTLKAPLVDEPKAYFPCKTYK